MRWIYRKFNYIVFVDTLILLDSWNLYDLYNKSLFLWCMCFVKLFKYQMHLILKFQTLNDKYLFGWVSNNQCISHLIFQYSLSNALFIIEIFAKLLLSRHLTFSFILQILSILWFLAKIEFYFTNTELYLYHITFRNTIV